MTAERPPVAVGALVAPAGVTRSLRFDLLAGARGLERPVTSPSVQASGLALTGRENFLERGRILVLGRVEHEYLHALAPEARADAVARALAADPPCLVLSDGLAPIPELAAEAERRGIPLLGTPLSAAAAIARLTLVLEDRLAPRQTIHGVLLDVLGLGVLMIGESGIGKSECALDLVVRGHRLVADDAVEVRRRSDSIVIGTGPDLTRYHMEIRGLGLIDVKALFGIASTRSSKRIELVIQFVRWDPGAEYDRLGLDEAFYPILDVPIPTVQMPVGPGRNLAILVEVAARSQLLRARGEHPARRLADRLAERLRERGGSTPGAAGEAKG